MNAELAERAFDLVKKVADEFERLAGLEVELPVPEELAKAFIDAQAYRDALAELFDKDNTDGRAEQMKPVREAFIPLFRKYRDAAVPFEEPDSPVNNVLTVKLYEQTGQYPAGDEPWPDNELIVAVGQLEEEVRRDRLLS